MTSETIDTPESGAAEHARIRAIVATDAVTRAVKETAAAVQQAGRDARVFRIPMQGLEDETPPTAPVPDMTGQAAIIQAAAALRTLEYSDHQHAMATVRCPGVIRVDADMSAAIADVNAAKQDLKTAMGVFGRSGWTVWRGRIPAWQRLNRLQAYRKWHWLDAPVRKIGFSWAGHTHSVEQLRIAELRDRLSRQDRERSHPHIESELARLEGFDGDEVVVIRKPIAPTPIANVAYADGRRRVIKTALPLILCDAMPQISPLPDFDPAKRSRVRDDQAIDSLLVAYWHAWRYQAPYRFRLPADSVAARLACDGANLSVRVRQQIALQARGRGERELAAVAALVGQTRGPVPDAPALDAAGEIRVVAGNRSHVYLVSAQDRVWRVPTVDVARLGA